MNQEQCAILRFGYVSDYLPELHAARVVFPDKDNLVSNWLPVLVHNSLKNHDETHVDINEHVACLMTGNGIESGIILGAIYDESNKPPESNHDIRRINFDDGTAIHYDRDKHLLTVNCVGDINMHADGHINITAARIDLN